MQLMCTERRQYTLGCFQSVHPGAALSNRNGLPLSLHAFVWWNGLW